MSYTAPAGNAVNFAFDGASYTAPAGGTLAFEFLAVPTRTVNVLGGVSVGGVSSINHGVEFSAFSRVSLSGMFAVDHGVDFKAVTGRAVLGGVANLLATPSLFITERVALTGKASLFTGNALSVVGKIKANGMMRVNAGRKLSTYGVVKLGTCSAQFRHGRTMTADGKVNVAGVVEISSLPAYSLACLGTVAVNGAAYFDVRREYPLSSISVFSATERIEVYCDGV